jgi:hypothetical protein
MTCSRCLAVLRSDNESGLCGNCWRSAYRTDNRERLAEMSKLYRDNDVPRALLQNARKRAKATGMEFDLEISDIYVPSHCPLLGVELHAGSLASQDCSPSLDRIDPTLGYIKGNVRVISHRANAMKSNASADELITFCQNVFRDPMSQKNMVEGVHCPRCSTPGPHDREPGDVAGTYVMAVCPNCDLKWAVTG